MTKKHFEAIARTFAGTRPQCVNSDHYPIMQDQWLYDVQAIAGTLAATNPKFDQERFVRACYGK